MADNRSQIAYRKFQRKSLLTGLIPTYHPILSEVNLRIAFIRTDLYFQELTVLEFKKLHLILMKRDINFNVMCLNREDVNNNNN